ncbi:LytS/YhcK type 5TM receptor domain-containing protein [Viridibacillus sp. NPDC096237]|uniref:LytS/YhcK type 5TM receptor domain-containing protein n=1 Tax=Viridibacillus sp. NPDC096237 TaxID=3390721 RepID=UPI003D0955ED
MFELFITMLERLGIIVMIAFILTRLKFLRGLMGQEQLSKRQQWMAILFFGFFGIIGTYSGMTFSIETQQFNRWASGLTADEAIANSRVIGVVIAGLLGGYKVGIGAGLIAGIHRLTLGGFTAIPCGSASILAGAIAGVFHKKNKEIKLPTVFFIGAISEGFQMLNILLLSKPYEKAWDLVELIGLPMIMANGLGCTVFLLILKNVVNEEEKVGAVQAQKTLRIADQTLFYLREGMNQKTAQAVCEILHKELQTSAVAITNQSTILAHVGMGDDHHIPHSPIMTRITRQVIVEGKLTVASSEMIHCLREDCQLHDAIVAPLTQRGETIGTMKFYFQSRKDITPVVIELISGLGSLLSNQLEIAAAEQSYQFAKELEIKALQAQISPHFLFNSMNTIVSLIRLDPDKARKLLVSLSHFLRQNLAATTMEITPLAQEIKHVKAYLEIEETRFVHKLVVIYDIDEKALAMGIPPLTLQPIVENAVKHGIQNMSEDCEIYVRIMVVDDLVVVTIEDNGRGMAPELAKRIGKEEITSKIGSGIALYNVNRRLTMHFGEEASIQVKSIEGQGTAITFSVPQREMIVSGVH